MNEDEETKHPPLPVRMIHDWGHENLSTAIVVGKTVTIVWGGGFDMHEFSLHTGRLKGSYQAKLWRMHRTDLRAVRKLAGWRRWPGRVVAGVAGVVALAVAGCCAPCDAEEMRPGEAKPFHSATDYLRWGNSQSFLIPASETGSTIPPTQLVNVERPYPETWTIFLGLKNDGGPITALVAVSYKIRIGVGQTNFESVFTIAVDPGAPALATLAPTTLIGTAGDLYTTLVFPASAIQVVATVIAAPQAVGIRNVSVAAFAAPRFIER